MPEFVADQYLRTIVDSLDELILFISPDLRVLYMNNSANKAFQLAPGNSSNFSCHALLHQRDTPCVHDDECCPVSQVLQTKNPVQTLRRLFLGRSQEGYYEITAVPLVNAKGEVVAVVERLKNVSDLIGAQQLRNSEERYRKIVHSASDAIITVNHKGVVIDCNPAVAAIFQYSAEELIGQSFALLMPNCLASGEKNSFSPSSFPRSSVMVEGTARTALGQEIPVGVSYSSWQAGTETFFTAIIRDLCVCKELEEELLAENRLLAQSQALLREKHQELSALFNIVEEAKQQWDMTLDCITDMVLLLTPDRKIMRCNRQFMSFIGRSYPEIIGQDWDQLFVVNFRREVVVEGEDNEFFCRRTGKKYVCRLLPLIDKQGGKQGTVVTLQDITERSSFLQELQEKNGEIETSRLSLQRALDEIASLMRQVIEQKKIEVLSTLPLLAETCWEKMSCPQIACPCHGQKAVRCWQIVGTHCQGEVQGAFCAKYHQCEKCPYFQSHTSDPLLQIGEQFNNMMAILKAKNDELEAAYGELKSTQSQILQQEKMASIGQLAAGVAHEINNPVGFVTSNLGTLDKYLARLSEFDQAQIDFLVRPPDEEAREGLRQQRKKLKIDYIYEDGRDLIRESIDGVERVKKIVQNLKNFSRVDQADYAQTDINICLEDTLNIVWNELKYKATVSKEYGELPSTRCYPQQLNQVFMNLLVNAAQAIDKQGEIKLKTWAKEEQIYISVSDTGCGIPSQNLGRLFEPFFTTKEIGKGTGLGLSIAYDIVTKKHAGALTVASEVGRGTTFTVAIPIINGDNDESGS